LTERTTAVHPLGPIERPKASLVKRVPVLIALIGNGEAYLDSLAPNTRLLSCGRGSAALGPRAGINQKVRLRDGGIAGPGGRKHADSCVGFHAVGLSVLPNDIVSGREEAFILPILWPAFCSGWITDRIAAHKRNDISSARSSLLRLNQRRPGRAGQAGIPGSLSRESRIVCGLQIASAKRLSKIKRTKPLPRLVYPKGATGRQRRRIAFDRSIVRLATAFVC